MLTDYIGGHGKICVDGLVVVIVRSAVLGQIQASCEGQTDRNIFIKNHPLPSRCR